MPQEGKAFSLSVLLSLGIFGDKHRVGKILIQDGNASVNNLSFPKHDDRGKGLVKILSLWRKSNENMQEAEPYLDRMARQIRNLIQILL